MRDEAYILDLCDRVLRRRSKRQYCFEFLRGDPTIRGKGRMLPVDAFYQTLNLVIEYRERRHSERVAMFDDKPTISRVPRGEQRRKYDARRRRVLRRRGMKLIEFGCSEFDCDGRKRLQRVVADALQVIRQKLMSQIRRLR